MGRVFNIICGLYNCVLKSAYHVLTVVPDIRETEIKRCLFSSIDWIKPIHVFLLKRVRTKNVTLENKLAPPPHHHHMLCVCVCVILYCHWDQVSTIFYEDSWEILLTLMY